MSVNQNKIALVTGASRGIGRAIAEKLSEDGYTVIINYSGNVVSAEETVETIKAKGGSAIAIQADISNENDVARLFYCCHAAHG